MLGHIYIKSFLYGVLYGVIYVTMCQPLSNCFLYALFFLRPLSWQFLVNKDSSRTNGKKISMKLHMTYLWVGGRRLIVSILTFVDDLDLFKPTTLQNHILGHISVIQYRSQLFLHLSKYQFCKDILPCRNKKKTELIYLFYLCSDSWRNILTNQICIRLWNNLSYDVKDLDSFDSFCDAIKPLAKRNELYNGCRFLSGVLARCERLCS